MTVPVGIRVSAVRIPEETSDLEALLRLHDGEGLLDFVSASLGGSDRPGDMLGAAIRLRATSCPGPAP